MRIAVLGLTMLAAAGSVQADEVLASHSPVPERVVTGTMIPRPVVTNGHIPIDKSYAELSPEQKSLLRAEYASLGSSDEPPYPLNGLKSISQRIANADVSATVDGELVMQVDVNSSGDATAVTTVHSPNARIAHIASVALQREKYKPAICRGQPCAMPFVFHVVLSSPR